jgi:ATP-dependent Lhr-like helicase
VYSLLRALEESGKVRRGYFVDGLGAAQFALPGAVDRLRDMREAGGRAEPIALAAADPAQPYGAALGWPPTEGRPSRAAGAYLVVSDGEPVVFLERGARTLTTFAGAEDLAWPDALAALVKDGGSHDRAPAHRRPERARGPARRAPAAAGFADG